MSMQLKIPPGGGFGRGCKNSYIFIGGGGGPGNLEIPLATPLNMRVSQLCCRLECEDSTRLSV